MKKCIKCDIVKDLIEFYSDIRFKDGFRNKCKLCVCLESQKWRKENKDKINDMNKKWINNNQEKVKNYRLSYNKKESRIEYTKKWRKENKEYTKEYYKINYRDLPKYKEYKKKWRDDNKEYMKIYYENNYEKLKEQRKIRSKIYNKKYNIMRSDRRKNDPLYALYYNISAYLRNSLKRKNYSKKSKTYQILGCSFEEFKLYLESKFEPWMNWDNRGLYNGELNYGWDIDHIIPVSSAKTEEEMVNLFNFKNLQPLCSKINRDIKKDKVI